MPSIATPPAVTVRIAQMDALYSAPDACAAQLLCDSRDAGRLAYRVIAADLSVRDISYGELRTESERFAAVLQSLGVRPGDRVATLMGKSRNYLVTLMGIWRLGAVHVPLFTAFAPPAIAYRLTGSGAKLVVCDPGQQPKLAAGEGMPADAPWQVITTGAAAEGALAFDALMATAQPGIAAAVMGGDAPFIHIYTSGTTGNPKGVVVPLRALAAFHSYAEFGHGLRPQDDIFWCAADPGWAYGLYFGVLSTFLTATRSILFEGGFSAEKTMTILAREGVTNFAAAPTVYRSLRSDGVAPPSPLSLRAASSAGEPLTPDVNIWAERALGVTVHDHYGQTEAGMLINNHHNPAVARPVEAGSMGQAMPGWTATVLDEREDREVGANEVGRVAMVMADSPLAFFRGYDGDPAKTAGKFSADGRYYLTGDTGRVDEEGYFHFSSRDDDVILMAGYRIGPFEVESAMVTHPAVAEAAVIAVPDEVRGEVIEAFVVLTAGHAASPELEREIQQWVKTRYAAHAYPRAVHFTDSLPKTPSGKVQRFVLKAQRLEALAAATQGA
ncbi:AMP-binding protein [Sphingobium sufflavum]|uniref:AMP-binding protein n=1 Tax=Sphingobium sufflavum TaxID=1129547 RepID=UPI001F1EE352|nr:AMP-binding protein [Sphingobium sufflavum]MCE7796494.1 AMP-binding protein [Sphingobium sufflavum]